MTLLDLMPFYRRAAKAKRRYELLCARLTAIDLILMRRWDIGRQDPPDGPWNTAKARVIQIALNRRRAFESLRFEARDRTLFEEDSASLADAMEGVRLYARDRKRGMC